MKPVTEELIREMTDTIVREVGPQRIILFGSHARGNADPEFDVDLIVVEDEPLAARGGRWRETSRIRRMLRPFRVPTDILVYSTGELDKWRDSINHIIGRSLREGRLLYERS